MTFYKSEADKLFRRLSRSIDRGMQHVATTMASEVRKYISTQTDGTRLGNRLVRASSPGRPPGIVTSRLINSIEAQRRRAFVLFGDISYAVGTNVRYAAALELGATLRRGRRRGRRKGSADTMPGHRYVRSKASARTTSGRLMPRPYLRPVFNAAIREGFMQRQFDEFMRKELVRF